MELNENLPCPEFGVAGHLTVTTWHVSFVDCTGWFRKVSCWF